MRGCRGGRLIDSHKEVLKNFFFQSSFRLSEKNEKDKKRKELTPISATPTHMLCICVNPSFKHLPSPRGDRCEHTSPTVRQLLNHGYRFETLKRRLGFTAVPCQAMANLAVGVGCVSVCEHSEIKFALHNTHVTPHPPLSRSPFSHWRRLAKILAFVSACTGFTPAPLFFSGRADNACTNLLGFLV